MSRVLIFGCSFSAGSYEYVPNAKSINQSEVVLPESPGWYNYVDHLGDKELTVIATHGEGYWFFRSKGASFQLWYLSLQG